MLKKCLFPLLIFLITFELFSQDNLGYVFKASPGFDQNTFVSKLNQVNVLRNENIQLKSIFTSSGLYAITSNPGINNVLKDFLNRHDDILWVEEDLPLWNRQLPNDEYFDRQWYLQQIKAVDAWNITTGGNSPLGDTIVLALLDDGFMADHFDLAGNVWHNWNEIPNDGIDNDNNGYVDDHMGLNLKTGTDLHSIKKHGTAVGGVMGASGNNTIGCTGVSWKVKLLLISEATSISNLIEGYQYVLDTRKKYNQSDGEEGAYIVASNLSAGIDNVFPDQNPLYEHWCEIYDELGKEGVLSINATTNNNTNIDLEGDMPGTCGSNFLITVTNSDVNDNKVANAGYGIDGIDLAAPGEDIFATSLANSFDEFSGTSSSAPQVSGTIALMYAAPCMEFAEFAANNPEGGASSIKNMLMKSVDQSENLKAYTKSGGRLNVLESINGMRDFCEGSTGKMEIINLYPNPATNRFTMEFETENYQAHFFSIQDALGRVVFQESIIPNYFGEKVLTFDLSNWKNYDMPFGIYIVSISDGKHFASKKLMIQ